MRKLLAWDVSYQLDPSWSNCLLPPPPPRKPTNPTVAKLGWERPPVDHCCHCRDDYGSTKSEKCLGLKGTNFTTEEVQTDLGRKWSSTVNKNYNVSTRGLQLPRHCYLSLLSTSSTTWIDFVGMICFWTLSVVHSQSFCHCLMLFVFCM